MPEQTAPVAYGKIYVVCSGGKEWCGTLVETFIEIPAGYIGRSDKAKCSVCGAEYKVHLATTKKVPA